MHNRPALKPCSLTLKGTRRHGLSCHRINGPQVGVSSNVLSLGLPATCAVIPLLGYIGRSIAAEQYGSVASNLFNADTCIVDPIGHSALVHLQLQPSEWRNIDDAKKAVQKEYDQLFKLKLADMDNVCEYEDVASRATRTGNTIHSGRLFPLCHIKHSELAK